MGKKKKGNKGGAFGNQAREDKPTEDHSSDEEPVASSSNTGVNLFAAPPNPVPQLQSLALSDRDRGHGRGSGHFQDRQNPPSSQGRPNTSNYRGQQGSSDYRGQYGSASYQTRQGSSNYQGQQGASNYQGYQGGQQGRFDNNSRGGRGNEGGQLTYNMPGGGIPPIDPQVQKLENEAIQAQLSKPNKRTAELPPRPNFGSVGAGVVLWANYVNIVPKKSLQLFMYSISIGPVAAGASVPKGKKLGRLVELLLADSGFREYRRDVITDFRSIMFSCKNIEDYPSTLTYRAENEDDPVSNAPRFTVELTWIKTLSIGNLLDAMTNASESPKVEEPEDSEYTQFAQAFNIFFNHYAHTQPNQVQIGSRRTFALTGDGVEEKRLPSHLMALRGYFSSVRMATNRLLVNVNVSHAVFWQEDTLDVVLRDNVQYRGDVNQWRISVNALLSRISVHLTHHPVRKNKDGQRILRMKHQLTLPTRDDGIHTDHPPRINGDSCFPDDVSFYFVPPDNESTSSSAGTLKGKRPATAQDRAGYITVRRYFERILGRPLRCLDQPVINVGGKARPIYIVPEVCQIVPGMPSGSKLSSKQTSEMITFAARRPYQNLESLTRYGIGIVGLDESKNAKMGHFGIERKGGLITVQGRKLQPPGLKYQKTEKIPNRGGWNVLGHACFRTSPSAPLAPRHPVKVGCIHITSCDQKSFELQGAKIVTMIGELRKQFALLGLGDFNFDRWTTTLALSDCDDPALRKTMEDLVAGGAEFLMFVLPFKETSLYAAIKRIGDTKIGIHTICMTAEKVNRAVDGSFYANIGLKVNIKRNRGTNHILIKRKEHLSLISEGNTMLVGIDVTHPSANSSENAPSIAAMVASIDGELGQYPADIRVQSSRQEMVDDLTQMLESRLALWKDKNRTLPENIVIYRDGVSEGQYRLVIDKELPQLRQACKNTYSKYVQGVTPRLTLVLVGKRHHTRFYPTKDNDGDRKGNCWPGTVVDRGVTHAQAWDFFLQAHEAIQGTAKPAHYYVLLDEVFSSVYRMAQDRAPSYNVADHLENFTHALCYTFGRATRAVSIAPPAYYADIVCERARLYLNKTFDQGHAKRLKRRAEIEGETDAERARAQQEQANRIGQWNRDVQVHKNLKDSMFYI